MIHHKSQQILSLYTSHGAVHDFELFKRNLKQIPYEAFIIAERYQNRSKRLDLRLSLITEIYNLQLSKNDL